jgi:hypothetical protein
MAFVTKDKVSFREIVLAHLSKILEISTGEFMGGFTKQVPHGNYIEHVYIPNSRKCYIQSVESLADVLIPHFDKEMGEVFAKYQTATDGILTELKEERDGKIKEDWEFRKKYMSEKGMIGNVDFPTELDLQKRLREPIKKGDQVSSNFIKIKLKYAQELFRELNKLLKRSDYLKTSVYSEGDLDEEDDDE